MKPQICHPYGTRSETKATPISVHSTDIQDEWRGHLGLGQWVRNSFGPIRDAAGQQLNSAESWSPENVLSSYLAGDHQSSV